MNKKRGGRQGSLKWTLPNGGDLWGLCGMPVVSPAESHQENKILILQLMEQNSVNM